MKTVSERRSDQAREQERIATKTSARLARWRAYVDQVEAKNIPVFVATHPAYRNHDYDRMRQAIRKTIRGESEKRNASLPKGEMWISTGHALGGFIDTACDNCGTALWDRDPSITNTSSPPCFWADCMGCGQSYTLGMEFRRGRDPI